MTRAPKPYLDSVKQDSASEARASARAFGSVRATDEQKRKGPEAGASKWSRSESDLP